MVLSSESEPFVIIFCNGEYFCFPRVCRYPIDPFTISKPRDQEIGEFYVVQDRRAPVFDAAKLRKGQSGV